MIRNANGDVLQVGVPVRRGTGPKARMRAFVAAFDAWRVMYDSKDGDDMTYEELQALAKLEHDMIVAREGITGYIGAM
jgi:hypothetical protein